MLKNPPFLSIIKGLTTFNVHGLFFFVFFQIIVPQHVTSKACVKDGSILQHHFAAEHNCFEKKVCVTDVPECVQKCKVRNQHQVVHGTLYRGTFISF